MSSMRSSPIHQSISRNGLAGISWNQTPTFRSTLGMCSISSHFPVSTLQRELHNTTSVDIKQHLQSLPSWRFTVENTGIYWHWGQCGSQLGFFGKSKLHQTKSRTTYHNQANFDPTCASTLPGLSWSSSASGISGSMGVMPWHAKLDVIQLQYPSASYCLFSKYWLIKKKLLIYLYEWILNMLTVDWVRPTLSLQHAVELVAALVLRMIQRNGPGKDNRPTLRTMRE